MPDIDDYQQLADRCLAMADDPKISGTERKALIEMAMAWNQMARDADVAIVPPLPRPH